ncbi:hypothetical protein AgCh_020188 [Apium graveolens]
MRVTNPTAYLRSLYKNSPSARAKKHFVAVSWLSCIQASLVSGNMKRGKVSRKDYVSYLPENIIDTILTKVPIRDAVRTSILSTKWRFLWSTMTQLVFDENCVPPPFTLEKSVFDDGFLDIIEQPMGRKTVAERFENFVLHFLLLHHGPVQKCIISTSYLRRSADIGQWLLVLSRKDIKELVLGHSSQTQLFHAPSHLFSCHQLTSLKLFRFELKRPPSKFQGFPCLKNFSLVRGKVTLEVIEKLISGCPLLEKFEFIDMDNLAFTIRAPNLKYLVLGGKFKDVYLEHAPLLTAITIRSFPEVWNGKIVNRIPVTYDCLKFINIERINHVQSELVCVLHFLLQTPNLEKLQISAAPVRSCDYHQAAGFGFWEEKCPLDFTFEHLKVVKMSEICSRHDLEFLKFVLGHSPVLEMMSISTNHEEVHMGLGIREVVNEVLHLQRASPKVVINFF